jgi:HB1, ASXL, restriction endonuclease HTH domain
MSKTKQPAKKAPSKGQATKAAKKPAPQATKEAPGQSGACPQGGDHEWKTEDGQRFCERCFEPGDKSAAETGGKTPKAKAKSEVKANGKLSAIDAAAKVLSETGQPMNTKEMITAMAVKGYWTSPGGKTPAATLYSAILREITTQGAEARFQKTERGKFALRGA